ncbi:CD27 antigen isoform X2 [Anabas testudineus]|nr:CD27 antigen isoform X2 [Anabas testudineus]
MQPLYIIFTFLSSLCCLSSVISLECNNTQYPWPVNDPQLCCNMCLPGQRMNRRSPTSCEIDCQPCIKDQYSDSCSVEMSCTMCNSCNKQNMALKTACNSTHNAVCTCIDGYMCNDQECTQCVLIPPTTKTTVSATITTETISTTSGPYKPDRVADTMWFLVIIALLGAGIALVLVTKIQPFLRWIRSKHGYFLTEKTQSVPQFAEDEEVSKPVQEVCGKCDQPIDV